MGYDVFTTKCPHNRVLRRLETCPQCVEQARAQAVAKAGPEQRHTQFYESRLPAKDWKPFVGVDRAGADEVVIGGTRYVADPNVPHNVGGYGIPKDFLADLQPVTPAGKWQFIQDAVAEGYMSLSEARCRVGLGQADEPLTGAAKLVADCYAIDEWVNAGYLDFHDGQRMKQEKLRLAGAPEIEPERFVKVWPRQGHSVQVPDWQGERMTVTRVEYAEEGQPVRLTKGIRGALANGMLSLANPCDMGIPVR